MLALFGDCPSDWLQVCRDAAAAVGGVLGELPTRLEREPIVGDGEGGDETTAVDAAAEAAVVGVLETLPDGFTLISEELGERAFGDGGDGLTVVCDPIDGSLNAKRGIPFFSLSLAVASGPRMDDVELGFVQDFGSGEEWVARRGEGAFLNGSPLDGPGPKERIEILSLEATRTDLVAEQVAGLVGFAVRTRVMGSLALSLCHLAAGRMDAVVSLKPAQERGHCRGPAARARARTGGRPARGPTVRRGPARSRRALARGRRRHARALRRAPRAARPRRALTTSTRACARDCARTAGHSSSVIA